MLQHYTVAITENGFDKMAAQTIYCLKSLHAKYCYSTNERNHKPASSLGIGIYLLSKSLFSSSNGEVPVFGLQT